MKSRKTKAVVKPKKKTPRKAGILVTIIKRLDDIDQKLQQVLDARTVHAQAWYNRTQSQAAQQRANSRQRALQQIFDDLRAITLRDSERTFVDSLEGDFKQYGALTPRQYECLKEKWDTYFNEIPF